MPYHDLRGWLSEVEKLGQLRHVHRAHWRLEMGAITELLYRKGPSPPPAVLFDQIPEYPDDFRVLFGMICSVERMALTLGLPPVENGIALVEAYREKLKHFTPISPRTVKNGPILENVDRGKDVNLLKFPVPLMHEQDGGRYIGTGCLVIIRDPDEGWINLGTYRGMVQDPTAVSLYISPGKHGRILRQKYFDQGKPCPVAVAVGQDPLLFLASGNEVEYGLSEYAYAGGFKGEPIEVVEAPETGLPIPAHAEIVYEGEMHPGDSMEEGPFGEWTGYYASASREEPVIDVFELEEADEDD